MSEAHDRSMPTLRAILLSLGSTGATANALSALEQRRLEERAVAGLEARLVLPVGAVTGIETEDVATAA